MINKLIIVHKHNNYLTKKNSNILITIKVIFVGHCLKKKGCPSLIKLLHYFLMQKYNEIQSNLFSTEIHQQLKMYYLILLVYQR